MILNDAKIIEYGDSLIKPFEKNKVQQFVYDLSADLYCHGDHVIDNHYYLKPMESVFVQCAEEINLPANLCAEVTLRNSRIREGLLLTAPIYHPGHHTKVFFRITNISSDEIHLNAGDGIASIYFHEMEPAALPYKGAFQNEFNFKNLGNYEEVYLKQHKALEKKEDDIHRIENTIYTTVLSILAVFVGIFSLINVNITLVHQAVATKILIVLNLVTVGSIGLLISFVSSLLKGKRDTSSLPLVFGIISFAAAILLQCFIH